MHKQICLGNTARSVEHETRNVHQNVKRNPNWNHKAIVLGLFSFENLKRDVEWSIKSSALKKGLVPFKKNS